MLSWGGGGGVSSALLDAAFGTTRGSLLYRGSSGWALRIPVAANDILTDSGVGGDPVYSTLSGILDAVIGSTRGTILARGALTWGAVGLPANNGVLGSNGTDIAGIGAQASFRGGHNGAISLTDSTNNLITFNTEIFKRGAITHSTSSDPSRITVTVAGLYQVYCSVTLDISVSWNTATNINMDMAKNGVSAGGTKFLGPNSGTSYYSCTLMDNVVLAVNDYIEFRIYQNSGGTRATLDDAGAGSYTYGTIALLIAQ